MRLIDADALLWEYDKRREPARSLIKNAPTVSWWVSAKNRLPTKKGLYLCQTQSADGAHHIDLCRWYRNGWKCKNKVIWWMPIEPPEEVQK